MEADLMDETNKKDNDKEQHEGNRMSHDNAEEHGENTVPAEESPVPSKKSS